MRPRELTLLAALIAAIASAGCSRGHAQGATGPIRRIGLAVVSEGRAGREAGRLAFAAAERQVRKRGGELSEVSVGGTRDEGPESSIRPGGLDILCISSRLEGKDGDQILRVLAEEGGDLVVAVGPAFAGSLARVAQKFPRVRFALIGAPAEGLEIASNATGVSFDDAQAAFLLGAFAAHIVAEEPKPKLGFIGGADASDAHAYLAGFQAGAAFCAPALRRPGSLFAQYYSSREATFEDPGIAHTIAASQYKRGAQIVFHGAGVPGRGIFEAAREAGKLAMGSEGEPVGDAIVASMEERADVAMDLLIDELFASGTVKPGPRRLGLREGAISYALDESKRLLISEYAHGLDEIRLRIASGEIIVPSDDESAARFIKALK